MMTAIHKSMMQGAVRMTGPTGIRLAAAACWLLCICVGAAGADEAAVIEFRAQAAVAGPSVKLKEIATLRGQEAAELGDIEVAKLPAGDDRLVISMDVVRKQLDGRGVNWGRITCRGAIRITITRDENARAAEPEAETIKGGANHGGGESAKHRAAAGPSGVSKTVRQLLPEWIIEQLELPAAQVRITFDETRNEAFEWSNLTDRLEFRTRTSPPVGRNVTIEVIRKSAGSTDVKIERVRASVEVQRPALIATRVLQRGQTITPDDLRADTLWMDSMEAGLVSDIKLAVGQRARMLVRADRPLTSEDIAAPEIVKRGQTLKATWIVGTVKLERLMTALEAGAEGQWIKVRADGGKKEFSALVVAPGEVRIVLTPAKTTKDVKIDPTGGQTVSKEVAAAPAGSKLDAKRSDGQ